jgi:hypothetical protein
MRTMPRTDSIARQSVTSGANLALTLPIAGRPLHANAMFFLDSGRAGAVWHAGEHRAHISRILATPTPKRLTSWSPLTGVRVFWPVVRPLRPAPVPASFISLTDIKIVDIAGVRLHPFVFKTCKGSSP